MGLAVDYFSHHKPHSGIIIAVRRPANEIAARIMKILDQMTSDEMMGQVIYI
jgi:hypothetical protein